MGFLDNLFGMQPSARYPEMPQIETALTPATINAMRKGIFRPIAVSKLVLSSGEICYYCDCAVAITQRMQVVGRKRNGGGFSVRVLRGLTYHSRDDGSDVIRDWVPEYTRGKLYVTNKRIVFTAESSAFSNPLSKMVAFHESEGNLVLQFGSMSKKIYTPTVDCAVKAIEYVV